jgi:hypothetical protein
MLKITVYGKIIFTPIFVFDIFPFGQSGVESPAYFRSTKENNISILLIHFYCTLLIIIFYYTQHPICVTTNELFGPQYYNKRVHHMGIALVDLLCHKNYMPSFSLIQEYQ